MTLAERDRALLLISKAPYTLHKSHRHGAIHYYKYYEEPIEFLIQMVYNSMMASFTKDKPKAIQIDGLGKLIRKDGKYCILTDKEKLREAKSKEVS